MRFRVEAPASSANLGSGFDAFGIALGLWMTLDVTVREGRTTFQGGPDLFGGPNLVLAGMQAVADATRRELPACSVSVRSEIPVARGLGSSATALVAGLVAGSHLLGDPLSAQELLRLGTRIEGHGDNVSASLFGGVTLSVMLPGGDIVCRSVPIAGELRAVVFVADGIGLTEEARRVVPKQITRADAVSNLSRSALVVLALMTGEFELLREAMVDRLHQPYRAALFPHLPAMIEAAVRGGAYGACLSGAGPSVLALAAPERVADVAAAISQTAPRVRAAGETITLDVARHGARVLHGATAIPGRGAG